MEAFVFYFLFIIWFASFFLAFLKEDLTLIFLALPLTFGIGIAFNTGINEYKCFGFENVKNDSSDNTVECKILTYTSKPMAMLFYSLGITEVAIGFMLALRNLNKR